MQYFYLIRAMWRGRRGGALGISNQIMALYFDDNKISAKDASIALFEIAKWRNISIEDRTNIVEMADMLLQVHEKQQELTQITRVYEEMCEELCNE